MSIGQVQYYPQVQSIFNNYCLQCHVSVNGSGALELDSYEYLMEGDSNNGPVVIPYNADSSLLYRVLLPFPVTVPNEPICCQMPKNEPPLTQSQISIIYNWINEGAFETGQVVSVQSEKNDNTKYFYNYPNPFNSRTKISYYADGNEDISISIYDMMGRKIKSIVDRSHKKGNYVVIWNGDDNLGNKIASGLYLIIYQNERGIKILDKLLFLK